ncbi:DNA-binding anti-repressor SinI [Peribacillus sp. NPDC096447]
MLISLFIEKGLDKEWAEMLLDARELGISKKKEIREFLNQSQSLKSE